MKIVNGKVMRLVVLACLFATEIVKINDFPSSPICAYDMFLVMMICEVTQVKKEE